MTHQSSQEDEWFSREAKRASVATMSGDCSSLGVDAWMCLTQRPLVTALLCDLLLRCGKNTRHQHVQGERDPVLAADCQIRCKSWGPGALDCKVDRKCKVAGSFELGLKGDSSGAAYVCLVGRCKENKERRFGWETDTTQAICAQRYGRLWRGGATNQPLQPLLSHCALHWLDKVDLEYSFWIKRFLSTFQC